MESTAVLYRGYRPVSQRNVSISVARASHSACSRSSFGGVSHPGTVSFNWSFLKSISFQPGTAYADSEESCTGCFHPPCIRGGTARSPEEKQLVPQRVPPRRASGSAVLPVEVLADRDTSVAARIARVCRLSWCVCGRRPFDMAHGRASRCVWVQGLWTTCRTTLRATNAAALDQIRQMTAHR